MSNDMKYLKENITTGDYLVSKNYNVVLKITEVDHMGRMVIFDKNIVNSRNESKNSISFDIITSVEEDFVYISHKLLIPGNFIKQKKNTHPEYKTLAIIEFDEQNKNIIAVSVGNIKTPSQEFFIDIKDMPENYELIGKNAGITQPSIPKVEKKEVRKSDIVFDNTSKKEEPIIKSDNTIKEKTKIPFEKVTKEELSTMGKLFIRLDPIGYIEECDKWKIVIDNPVDLFSEIDYQELQKEVDDKDLVPFLNKIISLLLS